MAKGAQSNESNELLLSSIKQDPCLKASSENARKYYANKKSKNILTS
jgi:hypothetical protein